MSRADDPAELGLAARQARARQLRDYDAQLVEVLEPEQHLPGLLEHLGTGRQVIEAEAQRHWPKESWESTSSGGPPRAGDLHVKVASIIDSDGSGRCVVLDVRLLRMDVDTETEENLYDLAQFTSVAIPLALVPMLVAALREQADYWAANPPPDTDEAKR